MRAQYCRLLAGFVLTLVVGAALAFVPSALSAQEHALPSQHVAAALLMDVQGGEVLLAVDADKSIPPASLAKIMTLLLVFDALASGTASMDDAVHVDDSIRGIYGATLGLKPGDTLTVRQAIRGVAVASANDAATALAVHMAGSEQAFVDRMNAKASELGLNKTYYNNAHGLPSAGQKTTAADMARLARSYILAHPDALAIHSERTFHFHGKTYANRNTLLGSYAGLDGLKTGYIKASGYCLVATAEREGRRLLSVVLGAANPEQRNAATTELLDQGFSLAASE